jgi:methionyl-tRNA formyltransferase
MYCARSPEMTTTESRRLRIVVAGTTATVIDCVAAWKLRHDVVGIVSMPEGVRPDNSADLRAFAEPRNIPYREVADINQPASIQTLQDLRPDILFSMWPKLMHRAVIDVARMACIGTHCTPLPANRGRHPLHWMIVLGIEESCVSFFLMDEGVDSGDILLQAPFRIEARADIRAALAAMAGAFVGGCAALAVRLATPGPIVGTPQDHRLANTWRARSVFDTLIDFRMTALAIDRLVRSFSAPFGGAKLVWRHQLIAIARAEILPADDEISKIDCEPGRILRRGPISLIVKADDRFVELYARDPADFGELPNDVRVFLPPTAYFEQCWPRIKELL